MLETEGNENGYEWIDLGLSVKWATCNVGANAETEIGKLYGWGETKAWKEEDVTNHRNYVYSRGLTYEKHKYFHDSYKFMYVFNDKDYLTKYNDNSTAYNGNGDYLTTLEVEDDAASQNMGGKWRTPTYKEAIELVDNCDISLVENYNSSGMKGYLLTSRVRGFEDKHIFFPRPTTTKLSDILPAGQGGTLDYFTNTICEYDLKMAYIIPFYERYPGNWDERYRACCIRAVCP